MKGPFKLKYKNSSFPFKEQEGNTIIDAAGSAYAIPESTSAAAEFMKGVAGGLSTKKTKDKDKDEDKDKDKDKKKKRYVKMDPKQNTRKPVTKPPGPDPNTEIEIPGANKPTWEW